MLNRRLLVAVLLSVVASNSEGGVTYRYSIRSDGALQGTSAGRVWIDGDRKRVEVDVDPDNPIASDVVITVDAKTTLINQQHRTYYHPGPRPAGSASSRLFGLPTQDFWLKGRPKITYRDAGAGPAVGEYATTKHVVQFSYVVSAESFGMPLNGDVEAALLLLVVPTLPGEENREFVRAGFPEVDDEVTRLLSAIDGLVVGSELSVVRKLGGGAGMRETTTMTVHDLKIVDIEDSVFAIPSGLTYQEPVVALPGK